ncbi:hypothetical protein BDN72DRAFT_849392 [Pluteus cervinus]|uniref:Uncharacterized protein n=1 Tax=Pluteus cervinus TaxID=181527 RepID=A0ACD3A7B7_9AGAR|nr:hypothetical protein BDN72DRAFT_849392 [Pluteus cervinus]
MRFTSFTSLVVLSLGLVGANAGAVSVRNDPTQKCLTKCGVSDYGVFVSCLQSRDQCPAGLLDCMANCLSDVTGGL